MTDDRRPPADPLAEIRAGLSGSQKELPSKLFYDELGSKLFEEITRLPEYYQTRTERALLEELMPRWMGALQPRSLVELGAGSARKTRIALDAMIAAGAGERYMPVDISEDFLAATASALRAEYPGLTIEPIPADIGGDFELPTRLPAPAVVAFLGSTIGNFTAPRAVELLRRVRAAMGPADRFLLGADLREDPEAIDAAYNDPGGVTAKFNLNLLRVLNREFDADFDLAAFEHLAFYHPGRHRVEMHLVARGEQTVTIPSAGTFTLGDGETIRTEISCKHDRSSIEGLLRDSGMALTEWATDPAGRYALVLAAPV